MLFTQLTPEAQILALKEFREELFEGKHYGNSELEVVTDDCSLFEPADAIMTEMFGHDYVDRNYGHFMIANDRKGIYYNIDAPYRHLECSEAIRITDDEMFYKWLGIGRKYLTLVKYSIHSDKRSYPDTIIEFELDDSEDVVTREELDTLGDEFEAASKKFTDHLKVILDLIEASVNACYEEEYMREWLNNNDYLEFEETGEITRSEDDDIAE